MSNTYHSLASGNFTQNWSDAGLITADDNWSGVPSIVGFRGDDMTSATGVDPQTLTGDGTVTVDVNANQTAPNTFSTGGIAEFALADATIALSGSGTADAPHIVLHLDTTGRSNVVFSFDARDLDGSTDNAIQPLAVQYRVGETGGWTNLPAGFIADATTGPSLATLVTPVTVTLPSAAENQPKVQVRVITTNAAGNDEWIGIDNIVVASDAAGSGGATQVSIDDVTIAEGNSGTNTMTFTVTRSDNSGAFSVDYATSDGTATAGTDYVGKTGTVSFTAGGALSQTVTVTINGDTDVEANETVNVTLSNLSNISGSADISDATAIGTIANEDLAPIALTKISVIQGAGTASPLVGQTVTVEAIVVGDFQNGDADAKRNLNGIYLQEEVADSDGDAATSEGIFVFFGSLTGDVQEGDRVQVTGTVSEYFGMTQLNATSVSLVTAGAVADVSTMAAAISLPAAVVTTSQDGDYQPDLEAFEGMLVTIPQTLTIAEQFQLDRFNEIKLVAGERPMQFTHENAPDAAGYDAHLRETGARTITYDDGLNTQNAAINNLDGFGPTYNTATAPRMGDTVTGLTGVLDYQWAGASASGSTWRVRSIEDGENTFVDANPRDTSPDGVGGRLTVGSFNVLNYFTTLATSGATTAVGLEPRGANNVTEFDRQTAKLVNTLVALDADILGLVELENDFQDNAPGNALDYLVDSLNAVLGAGTYNWIDPGQRFVGGDAIAVGFIYKPAKVTVAFNTTIETLGDSDLAAIGQSSLLAQSSVGAIFDGANTSRNALAVTWSETMTGEHFTTVVNHFKSKGGAGTGADADALDGAGNWNNQRELAAKALDAWIDSDPTGTTDDDYILLGDFNAYFQEDPIEFLIAQEYENLQETRIPDPYSYVFDGQLGSLDYIFASPSMASQVTGITEWHINSDEADALDYNTDFSRDSTIFDANVAARVSDHDPLLIGLNLGDIPVQFDTYAGPVFTGTTTPTGKLEITELSSITLTSGAEISAFDPTTDRLFVTSDAGLQVVNFANPTTPVQLATIDLVALGLGSNNVSSVAFKGGVLVAAIIATDKTLPGTLAFIDPATGTLLKSVTVGANPDHVTFTPDGKKILVANEGEVALNGTDPAAGSVSIIDISGGVANATVQTATFTAFDGQENALRGQGVRLFDGKTVSQDVEPEYIAVSPDGTKAMVTLQEANAVAILDIATATFTSIEPLGVKDFSTLLADFSDRDGPSNTTLQKLETGNPVFGMFMPDCIASFEANGQTYYVIANEGDDRDDFLNPDETIRVGSNNYDLDNATFPNEAALKANGELGRLTVSNATGLRGDNENDGDIDQIITYGGRSFSIVNSAGEIVFDSGDIIDRIVATGQSGLVFDDTRSDNKGSEPEGISIATIGGKTYAFVGLERAHGTLAFDVTDPSAVTYAAAAVNVGDLNPEGLLNISAADSPTGKALLVVSNEVSNTLTTFELKPAPAFTLQLLHFADGEAGLLAGDTAPNLAALVDAFDDDYANTLILAGGDNFLPGPFLAAGTDASVAATHNKGNNPGAADIEIHNRIGVEASTIGNHEFDLGTNAFSDVINDAAFPYLSSNLDFSADSGISSRYQETVGVGGLEEASSLARKIVPSAVATKGGEKIGLVGVTTQILETISSTGNVEVKGFAGDGLEANDMALLAAQLQPVIDDLRAQGVDKIILMAHLQQIAFEQALAPLLEGVDIILAAGSNTRLGDADDVAVPFPGHAANFANTYPIVTAGKDGKTTLIVNTDNEYTYLGRLVVEFDENGDIITDSLADMTDINGAYASTTENVAEAWGDFDGDLSDTAFAEGTKGEQVADITEAVDAVIAAKDGQVFGYTNVYLEGERNLVRNQETNLGNITADANLEALSDALGPQAPTSFMVSLKNGGGIRAQIGSVEVGTGEKNPPLANEDAGKAEGGISQLDIENSLRFNNGLMAFDTTAEGLKAILEHGVAVLGNQGRYPQIGGMRFSYDKDLPAGSRVQNIALIDENDDLVAVIVENGVVNPDAPATITMVTLNFLANGGDGYPMKANGENFRFLLNDGTLSAPVDEALNFTAAGVVPANILGEQQAMVEYVSERYSTPETAFDQADTDQTGDTRIQNLDFKSLDTVLFEGEQQYGTTGNDTIVGGDGADALFGGAGEDTLLAGEGGNTDATGGVIFRLYNALLDRNPEAGGFSDWLDTLGSDADLLEIIRGILNSIEFNNGAGGAGANAAAAPLGNSDFVTLLYNNALDRAPDAGGLSFWVDLLNKGVSREQVTLNFVNSPEAIDKADYDAFPLANFAVTNDGSAIFQLYDAAFDRGPDNAGFLAWADRVDNGATAKELAEGFLNSGEFANRYGSLSNADFIKQVYRNALERDEDASGLKTWMDALAAGTTRADVLYSIATSDEALNVDTSAFGTYLKTTMTSWNDILEGGAGNDTLFGGRGADKFIFRDGFGTDTLYGYEAGIDTIDFSAITGLATISDLGIAEVAGNVEITFGSGKLILNNTRLAQFNSGDFIL
jgi:predicted extracellular nuclease/2',3'-cyclic-nucleotide 2'-phosphodiesterase (5'-nucleotidase family)